MPSPLLTGPTYLCEWLERGKAQDFKTVQGLEEPPSSWKGVIFFCKCSTTKMADPPSPPSPLLLQGRGRDDEWGGGRAHSQINTLDRLCFCDWIQPPKASLERLWLRKWDTKCFLLTTPRLGFNSGATGKPPIANHALIAREEPQRLLWGTLSYQPGV